MAGAATLLFIFCFFTTTERVVHKNDRKPLRQQIVLLCKNDQWMVLAWVCVIGTIGYVIRGSVAMYYAKYYPGRRRQARVGLHYRRRHRQHPCHGRLHLDHEEVLQDPAFPLVTAGHIRVERDHVSGGEARRHCRRFVLYFLINFIVDLQGPVFWSIISEAVDHGQVKSGKRVAGMAFGGISFCQKMGMSLAAGLVGWLLTYIHYQPDTVQSLYTLKGFALLLTVIPGVFHLAMGLLMYKYFITDKYYNENIRKLVTQEGADGAKETAAA